MSLLDRWVANTKRVLAKDKNTGSEYEFESIFPDGAPDGTAFSAENMNKIIDAVNGLDESKGQPNGIATLDSNGKLAQMPTHQDVGAPDIESGSWTPILMGSDDAGWYTTASSIGRYVRVGNVVTVSLVITVKKVPEAAKSKFVLIGGFPKSFDQRCGMGASFAIPYSTGIARANSTGQLFGTVYLSNVLILRYPNANSFVNLQGSAVSDSAIIAGHITYLCQ